MDPASTVSAPGDDESDLEDGDSAASVSEDGDFEDDGEFDEFDEDGTEQDGAEQEQEQAAYLTILDGETPAGGDGGVVGSTHPGGDGAPQSETVPYHAPGGTAVATLEAPASVIPPMPQQPYSRADGSSGGATTVDFPAGQGHIASAQEPQLWQPESEISAIADLESLNSTSHPQQQQQQQRTTGGRKIARDGAGRHTSTVSPEKREALAALQSHPDKPRHSKTSFATIGLGKNIRSKVNAAGHGIYDMLHKHFGSKEDHEVLKKFPWDNSVHEAGSKLHQSSRLLVCLSARLFVCARAHIYRYGKHRYTARRNCRAHLCFSSFADICSLNVCVSWCWTGGVHFNRLWGIPKL